MYQRISVILLALALSINPGFAQDAAEEPVSVRIMRISNHYGNPENLRALVKECTAVPLSPEAGQRCQVLANEFEELITVERILAQFNALAEGLARITAQTTEGVERLTAPPPPEEEMFYPQRR